VVVEGSELFEFWLQILIEPGGEHRIGLFVEQNDLELHNRVITNFLEGELTIEREVGLDMDIEDVRILDIRARQIDLKDTMGYVCRRIPCWFRLRFGIIFGTVAACDCSRPVPEVLPCLLFYLKA
jgi:hypothetical protein